VLLPGDLGGDFAQPAPLVAGQLPQMFKRLVRGQTGALHQDAHGGADRAVLFHAIAEFLGMAISAAISVKRASVASIVERSG